MAGCLAEAGYKLAGSAEAADLIIYNTCAVKGPTENRMINLLRRVPAEKKVIVAGCLPLINFERLRSEARFDCVIGPAAGKSIVAAVERVLDGNKIVSLKDAVNTKPSLSLPRQRLNPLISIVPVSYGCLGSCAYCCVAFARGRLRSYGIDEIVERMKSDLDAGVREFWVTSEDAASYGKDLGVSLAELLRAMCSVDGNFKIRVGMMTPNITLTILGDLVEAFKDEKIFKFLHLPVQSGDDKVLKSMRRFYSVNDFTHIVETFRRSFPRLTLATDIICGFPGETREAFARTLKLISEVKPGVVNVSKFFARPKTLAAKMQNDFVSPKEIKSRSSNTAELVRKVVYERNRRWVGWTGEILVDEVGKLPGSWVGRNFAYKPIVVRSADDLFGRTVNVKVERAFSTYLVGRLA